MHREKSPNSSPQGKNFKTREVRRSALMPTHVLKLTLLCPWVLVIHAVAKARLIGLYCSK